MFTKFGYNTIGIILIIALILVSIGIYSNSNYLRFFIFVFAGLIVAFTLNFFRDPDRIINSNKNSFLSPADGKVMLVKKVIPNRYINEECWQVSIFMSPLDVHVNRIPVDGKVEFINYIEGKYLMAFNDKADSENERNEIGILSSNGKILFTQVAGFIARRIISELKIGQSVKQGDRFGMIKFGSRCDIILPLKWEIKVKTGQQVYAGTTVLFEIPNEKN